MHVRIVSHKNNTKREQKRYRSHSFKQIGFVFIIVNNISQSL